MAFYIVHKKNPYFKNGEIIELFTDGFQRCKVDILDHRIQVEMNQGFYISEKVMKPYCIKLLRKGFDKPGLRTRRTEYAH